MSGKDRATRRLRAKYKKLIGELKYLYTDLEYHKEEHQYRKEEFHEDFAMWCEQNGYDCSRPEVRKTFEEKQVDPYNQKVSKEEAEQILEEILDELGEEELDDSDKDLKTLYKKVATKTHPDKILQDEQEAREKKQRLFIEAKEAYDNQDFFRLSQIAEELGVEPPPPSKQQLMWMREEKKKIEKIIEGIAKTYEWVCGEENPILPRDVMYQKYASTIGCVKLQKEG